MIISQEQSSVNALCQPGKNKWLTLPGQAGYARGQTKGGLGMQEQIVALLTQANKEGFRYISGGDIAKELGVTRAAIWKYIESIRKEGGIIEAVPRHGYHLVNPEDLLLAGAVEVKTETIGTKYVYLSEADSTNSEAKRRLRQQGSLADGLVVVADCQTAGKGRMGRGWHSVPGKGIYFSVVLFPEDLPMSKASLLTPLTAVAVYEALVKVTGLPIELKWPNDLMLRGRKLGGILLEASGETDRLRYAVIGIGINVNLTKQDIPDILSDIATSIYIEGGKTVPRRHLLQEMLGFLDTQYGKFLTCGPEPMLTEYRRLCSTLGQRIRFIWRDETYSGLAIGIHSDGGLMVQTDSGESLILRSGDVHCL